MIGGWSLRISNLAFSHFGFSLGNFALLQEEYRKGNDIDYSNSKEGSFVAKDCVKSRTNGWAENGTKTACDFKVADICLSVLLIAANDGQSTRRAEAISNASEHLKDK